MHFQGKGEVFTYWLVDEDKSVRQARLRASAAYKCHGDPTQKPCCVSPEHRSLTYSISNEDTGHCDAMDSPRSKRPMSRDRERRLSPEGGFFEIFKESENVSIRGSGRSSSFHRRRSLEGRPRSREVSKEVVNVNGYIANSDPPRRVKSTTEKSRVSASKTGSQRETPRVPSIVVDSHQNEADIFTETDCLLDSGLCSEHSTKDRSPGDLEISSMPDNNICQCHIDQLKSSPRGSQNNVTETSIA